LQSPTAIATVAGDLDQVDLSEADHFESGPPHEIFKRLRAEPGLHRNRSRGEADFWSLTRYDDINVVVKDHETFSSARPIAFMHDEKSIIPIEVLQGMMINMDPPVHSRSRKIVARAFTPAAMAAYEPQLKALCAELVDNVIERGACDFVEEIAITLPLAAITLVMGIENPDIRQLFNWTNHLIGAQDPTLRPADDVLFKTLGEIGMYTAELVQDRTQNPRDDLMSRIIHAEIDGERLAFEELVSVFILLFGAGNETSRNSLSIGWHALMEHPDQRRMLLDDPARLDGAIEEILRYVSPLMDFRRTATRDTEINGHPIAEGDKVVMWYCSGNRDERVFENPDALDITRDFAKTPHLSFGAGIHKCLGQHLAKLELRLMLSELLKRVPEMELAGEIGVLRSNLFYGYTSMPVTFAPGRRSR
jgi:linalool 8-monooxygenase